MNMVIQQRYLQIVTCVWDSSFLQKITKNAQFYHTRISVYNESTCKTKCTWKIYVDKIYSRLLVSLYSSAFYFQL